MRLVGLKITLPMRPSSPFEAFRLVARKRIQVDELGRLHAIPFIDVNLDDELIVVRPLPPVHPADFDVREQELGTASHCFRKRVYAQDEVGCAYRVDREDRAVRGILGDGYTDRSRENTYLDRRAGNAT